MTDALDPLAQLADHGVSIWLDDLSRELLAGGELQRLIDERHVVGVTTNPTIFASALAKGERYTDQLANDTEPATGTASVATAPPPPRPSTPRAPTSGLVKHAPHGGTRSNATNKAAIHLPRLPHVTWPYIDAHRLRRSTMPDYEATSAVSANADTVFSYLSDVQHLPKYFSRRTSAAPGDGDTVEVTADVHGHQEHDEAWFHVDDATKAISWGSEGPNNYHGQLRVNDTGNASDTSNVTAA